MKLFYRLSIVFLTLFTMGIGFTLATYFSDSILIKVEKAALPEKQEETLPKNILEASALEKIIKIEKSLLNGEIILNKIDEKLVNVMVENEISSWPQQYGISEAQVVHEALAEGGITRFMLQFSHNYPEKVGPVRSARPYFVNWANENNCVYVHCGGSPEALNKIINSENIINIDEGLHPAVFRDYNYNAPHNLFVDLKNLAENNEYTDWQVLKNPNFLFCEDCYLNSDLPKVDNIKIDFSFNKTYNISFTYDQKTKNYLRNLAGLPHIDKLNNEQINPHTLIIQYADSYVVDDKLRLKMNDIGIGEAEMFTNGKHLKGFWKKEAPTNHIFFYDPKTGVEWKIPAGQIWIATVNSPEFVSYIEYDSNISENKN